MKKLLCFAIAVLMCCSMVLPVMAEEGIFIPSMGIHVKSVMVNGEDVTSCFAAITITDAKDGGAAVNAEEAAAFVDAYESLADGDEELPVQEKHAYEDMSLLTIQNDCQIENLREELKKPGVTLTAVLDLELEELEGTEAYYLSDGQWKRAEGYTVNPDGTVTVELEDLGPFVVITPEGKSESEEQEAEAEESVRDPESEFVPSITYKEGPQIIDITINAPDSGEGEGVKQCIVTTSVNQAIRENTDISAEDRTLLLELYAQLEDGTMTLPVGKEHVIRDLVDVNFFYQNCRQKPDHQKKIANLEEDGVTVTVTFRMNVAANEDVLVFSYLDGQWVQAEEVTNNGDGTLTCILEDVAPVAFVVSGNAPGNTPWTGDAAGANLGIWIGLMAVCAIGVVALIIFRKKLK